MIIKKIKGAPLIFGVFFCILLITVDFLVKFIVVQTPFTHICNTGIALGIHLPPALFIILWIVFVLGFAVALYRRRTEPILSLTPFLLIISGAIANLIDRILYGCVVDYIQFFNISFFNLADAYITIGAILFIGRSFLKDQ